MKLKVFGYSISLNILILIGTLYLIMVVNALSASCNREGNAKSDKKVKQATYNALKKINSDLSGLIKLEPTANTSTKVKEMLASVGKLKSNMSQIAVNGKVDSDGKTLGQEITIRLNQLEAKLKNKKFV